MNHRKSTAAHRQKTVILDDSGIAIGNDRPLVLFAGPCVIESEEMTLSIARRLKAIAAAAGVPLVFKASFDKANRSSVASFRGPGLEKGLAILRKVKERYGLPLITDIHEPQQAEPVAAVVDIIQVPAFLCRQTDLLLAAARTGRPVSVKKGQFLAPEDMAPVIKKIVSCGNSRVLLTERGTSFGYHNLVVDMRSLEIMKATGYPVIFDATHAVQLPGGLGDATGGRREFVQPLATAAVSLGIAGVFIEAHPNPAAAASDGPNSLALAAVPAFLKHLLRFDAVAKRRA